jgi:hypothetical protein
VLLFEVGVEFSEQRGHGRGERVAVFVQGHRRGRIRVDPCPRLVQPVAAFDGAMHSLFAHDFQHARLCQQADVPIHSGPRHIGQASAQLVRVLLDPAHEDYNAYMPKQLNEMRSDWDPDQVLPDELPGEVIQLYRGMFDQEMTGWPAEIREPLVEHHVSPEWVRVALQEAKNIDQLYDEIRSAGRPMPDVPLIILCSMETDGFKEAVSAAEPEALLLEEIETKRKLYTAVAGAVPRGEIRLVDAGHVTMHYRSPEAVIQAIQDLLGS